MRSQAVTRRQAEPRRDPAAVLAASTFSAGIALLPDELQADARTLYMLLRTIDDLVDEGHPDARHRVEAIERWAAQHEHTNTQETRTLTDLTDRYPISRQALISFCQGMRRDLANTPIATEEDHERYCGQAGGAVGIMLAGLLGTTHPDAETRMATLGTAMQRTNILRDIDEDRANGRMYIAASTIARYGFPAPGRREALLRDQIARADALYDEGQPAIEMLRNGRLAMGIATALYREILRQIERDGYGRNPGRAKVPTRRKLQIIAEQHAAPSRTAARSTNATSARIHP